MSNTLQSPFRHKSWKNSASSSLWTTWLLSHRLKLLPNWMRGPSRISSPRCFKKYLQYIALNFSSGCTKWSLQVMMMTRVAAELKVEIAQRKEQEPLLMEPSSGLPRNIDVPHQGPSGPTTSFAPTQPTGCPQNCVVMDWDGLWEGVTKLLESFLVSPPCFPFSFVYHGCDE